MVWGLVCSVHVLSYAPAAVGYSSACSYFWQADNIEYIYVTWLCVSYLLVGWSSTEWSYCVHVVMWAASMHSHTFIHLSLHALSQDDICTSPLQVAAGHGHTDTVKRLLSAEANINYQDKVRNICCSASVHLIAGDTKTMSCFIFCTCLSPVVYILPLRVHMTWIWGY